MTRATRLDYGDWMQAAFDLDAENKQLRLMMTNMLIAMSRHDELVELGRGEIERRLPKGIGA